MVLSRITESFKKYVGKLSRFEGPQKLKTDVLWIDLDSAPQKINSITSNENIRDCLNSIYQNGYGVLKKAVSGEDCDRLIQSFKLYCSGDKNSGNYRDKNGLHDRLSNFHLVSQEAQAVLLNKTVQETLKLLLGENPKLVGSLFFEKSTQQDFHRDSPAFFTSPMNHYFGVWFALEDIKDNQGPLHYYEKSHRLKSDIDLRLSHKNSDSYQAELVELALKSKLEVKRHLPNKGDVLIWHPQLLHGGSEQIEKTKSRYSMVFHWMSKDCKIHSVNDFFSGKTEFVNPGTLYKNIKGILAIDHQEPRFFHDRKEGNFDEFK